MLPKMRVSLSLCLFVSICLISCLSSVSSVIGAPSNCTLGVDLATPASQEAFQCMYENGIQYATIRVFQSNCWLDPHAVDSIHAAWLAGLIVDVYLFPSYGCDLTLQQQLQVTLEHLSNNNAPFNTLWIDVEDWSDRQAHTHAHTNTHKLYDRCRLTLYLLCIPCS